MLDIISTAISFVSIIQNIHNKKNLREKVDEIRNALNSLDDLFLLLLEAKTAHDDFEKFDAAALSPLLEFFNGGEKTQKTIKQELENFVKLKNLFLKDLDRKNNIVDRNDFDSLTTPKNISENIKNIYNIYPKFINSINFVSKSLSNIEELIKISNFGDELEKSLILLESSSNEVKGSADDLILNITPIFAFFHYEIKAILEVI